MKKRFAIIISAVMIAIFCLFSVSALADMSVTTTARLNLRTAPGTEYVSQGIVGKGVTLNVYETGKDSKGITWYRVTSSGKTGWICASYTRQAEIVAPSKVKLSGDAHIRSGAGLGYASVGIIKKNAEATYLNAASVDNRGVVWYKISYSGKTGWVSSKYAALK